MSTTWLEVYEQRVTERYLELVTAELPTHVFDPSDWVECINARPPLNEIPVAQQFPRERWITYPIRRAHTLLTVDRALDLWDTLTGVERWNIAFLLAYGGRGRIG